MARRLTVPVVQNSTGAAVECAALREISVQIDGTFSSTNQIQGSLNGTTWFNVGAAASSPAVVNVTGAWMFLRNSQSSFVSGTPTIALCGHEEK